MNTNPALQDRAVEAAARFLEIRGYETLATGWKSPETRGTIDLVARDPESDDLVFVDVSARRTPAPTSATGGTIARRWSCSRSPGSPRTTSPNRSA